MSYIYIFKTVLVPVPFKLIFQYGLLIWYKWITKMHIQFCLQSGGGSMVGAVRGSTQREPIVVGKPSTFMMDYLADK